jgi:TRAP transporter 4TM/12TM fusion protein
MDSTLKKYCTAAASVILVASSIFIMYTSGFGLLSAMSQRTIHWAFMIAGIFLLYPWKKGAKIGWFDILLAVAGVLSTLYVLFTWEKYALRIEDPAPWEIGVCIFGVIVVLEATRRSMGLAMPLLAVLFLLYALYGNYLPGMFRHKGFALDKLVSFIYTTTEGIFGLAMGVSATYIVIFVLFGSFLAKSGAGQLFVDLSMTATGWIRSGPACATILSNALMGIISGSPVANVVTTGAFTMPLMTRAGYPLVDSAAILAVAATGSMFTPPVMGAAAFLIADYLSVSYGMVILASVIPAGLFYLSLFIYSDVCAAKNNLARTRKEDLVDWKKALRERGLLILPIILLVVLIIHGWSPLKSAFWCVILIYLLALPFKNTRMSLKTTWDALVAGSKDSLSVAAACATAGIIVGVVSMTGVGVKFSSVLMQISNDIMPLALALAMLAALVMGMGLPPTAVYIIMAALTVPALVNMGVTPMASHFFIFYFSCIGAITPPVALAAYSAAAVAKTDAFQTGWKAFRIGIVAFIIPFMFAYNPVMLLQGEGSIFEVVVRILLSVAGVFFLTYGLERYFRAPLGIPASLLFVIGAVCMLIPETITDYLGVGCIVAGILLRNVGAPAKKNN